MFYPLTAGFPIILVPVLDQLVVTNSTAAVFNASFQCAFHAFPSYTLSWVFTADSHEEEMVVYNSESRILQSSHYMVAIHENQSHFYTSQLMIINVKVEDGGVYRCVVSTNAGSASSAANLTVYSK